jgi:hypothetical protein
VNARLALAAAALVALGWACTKDGPSRDTPPRERDYKHPDGIPIVIPADQPQTRYFSTADAGLPDASTAPDAAPRDAAPAAAAPAPTCAEAVKHLFAIFHESDDYKNLPPDQRQQIESMLHDFEDKAVAECEKQHPPDDSLRCIIAAKSIDEAQKCPGLGPGGLAP